MKFFLSLCFIFTITTTFAQNNIAANSYYQFIKNEQTNIGREIYFFKNSVSDLNLKILTFQIKKSLAIVDTVPAYNNEVAFKNATIELFKFFLKVSQNQYPQLLKYVEDPELDNKAYVAKVKALFQEISSAEKPVDAKFNAAEDAYLAKYHIKTDQ